MEMWLTAKIRNRQKFEYNIMKMNLLHNKDKTPKFVAIDVHTNCRQKPFMGV